MSCILYSNGAYLKLQRESQLARSLAADIFQQPLAEFLFELNADAYIVRYGDGQSNLAEVEQARADMESDYEFELADWNDPTLLRDLLRRIEYQCADIHTREDEKNPRFQSLIAMREECERRMAHPIYKAEALRKQIAAQELAAIEKANSKEQFIKELRAQYPWAKAPNASKNLKKELCLAFPGVKFSVRVPHHGSLTISWTDGPTGKQVEAIANKYEDGDFDGMTDCYKFDHSTYGQAVSAVLGRSRWVSTSRSLSARFLKDIALEVCMKYGHDDLPVVTGDETSAWIPDSMAANVPYCSGAHGVDTLGRKIQQVAYETARIEPWLRSL